MALAVMDSSESVELPLDYLQGHKDGLEWAAQLAEANHPETGEWLYDDPIELAKAIRKGPDMPPAQPAADSEPVENHIGSKNALDAIVSFIKSKSNPTVKCYEEVSEQLFKDNCHGIHSHVIEYILKLGEELEDLRAEQAEMQPAPVVPDELLKEYLRLVQCMLSDYRDGNYGNAQRWIRHIAKASDDFEQKHGISPWKMARKTFRSVMLNAQPQNAPQNIPEIIPGWIPVSERIPEDRKQVILWDAEIGEVTSGHYSHKTQTFYHCGDAIENEITHWMPPTCAPQEVKR
nr:DUF551 domain-containing protein [Klebsiella pneumoniae]